MQKAEARVRLLKHLRYRGSAPCTSGLTPAPITQQEAHGYFVSPTAEWLGAGENGLTKLVQLDKDRKAVVKLHTGRNSFMPEMIDGVNRLRGKDSDVNVNDNIWTSEVFARRESYYHRLAWLRFLKNDEWLARQLAVPACMDFEPTAAPMVYYINLSKFDTPNPNEVAEHLKSTIFKDAAALQSALNARASEEEGTVKVTDIPVHPVVAFESKDYGVVCVTLKATFENATGDQKEKLIASTLAEAAAVEPRFVDRAYYTAQGVAEPSPEEAQEGFIEKMTTLKQFLDGQFLDGSPPLSLRGAWTIAEAYGRLCGTMNRNGIFHGDLHAENILVFPRRTSDPRFCDDPIRWRVIDWGVGQMHEPHLDQDGAARACEFVNAYKRLADEPGGGFAKMDQNTDGNWLPERMQPPGVMVKPRSKPGYDGAPHGDKYDFHIQPEEGEEYCRGERQQIYKRLALDLPHFVPPNSDGSSPITESVVTEWIWKAYKQAIGKKEERPQGMWPKKGEEGEEMAALFEATTLPATSAVPSEDKSWLEELLGWRKFELAASTKR